MRWPWRRRAVYVPVEGEWVAGRLARLRLYRNGVLVNHVLLYAGDVVKFTVEEVEES